MQDVSGASAVNETGARSCGELGPRACSGVTFGAGPWQHVGFADDGFTGRFAVISTFNTADKLFARTSAGAETTTELAGVAPGTAHDVRIVWTASAVTYLVSDEAEWITGVIMPVDGGYMAK